MKPPDGAGFLLGVTFCLVGLLIHGEVSVNAAIANAIGSLCGFAFINILSRS